MPQAMRELGSRFACSHIHDNYYNKDLHVMPFQGDIDRREQMETLRETGYKSNLTFEFVYGTLPDAMVADFLNTAGKTGRLLKPLFEEA